MACIGYICFETLRIAESQFVKPRQLAHLENQVRGVPNFFRQAASTCPMLLAATACEQRGNESKRHEKWLRGSWPRRSSPEPWPPRMPRRRPWLSKQRAGATNYSLSIRGHRASSSASSLAGRSTVMNSRSSARVGCKCYRSGALSELLDLRCGLGLGYPPGGVPNPKPKKRSPPRVQVPRAPWNQHLPVHMGKNGQGRSYCTACTI